METFACPLSLMLCLSFLFCLSHSPRLVCSACILTECTLSPLPESHFLLMLEEVAALPASSLLIQDNVRHWRANGILLERTNVLPVVPTQCLINKWWIKEVAGPLGWSLWRKADIMDRVSVMDHMFDQLNMCVWLCFQWPTIYVLYLLFIHADLLANCFLLTILNLLKTKST